MSSAAMVRFLVVAVLALTFTARADAAPAWIAATPVSAASQDAIMAQAAMDAQGDIVVVWRQFSGSNAIVQAATRPAGGNWQAPVDLSASGQDASVPQVAIDPQGNAVAVWQRSDGANTIVQAATRPAGGNWQAPVDLSAPGQDADLPQVAVDPQGNALAVWQRSNGTNTIVQAANRPAGGNWQAPVDVSAAGKDASVPDVAVDPLGNAIAIWERSSNGSNSIVQVANRPVGGDWQAPVDLSAAEAGNAHVALDSGGDAVAVWSGTSGGSQFRAQAAVRPAGGAWQPATNLSASGLTAVDADVALDEQGNAIAVWRVFTPGGANQIVQSAIRPAGGDWGSPTDLSAAVGTAVDPQVVIAPSGDALAVWRVTDDSNHYFVQSATRPAGGSWTGPTTISGTGPNPSMIPRLAVDAHGNAVAVWARNDGTEFEADFHVEAAGYDASGPNLNDLHVPATASLGSPAGFSVTPVDVWSQVGTTHWDFGDGSATDGTSVTHAYAALGTYTVTLTSADSVGNTTTASRQITVTTPPAAPTPSNSSPPTISGAGTARSGDTLRAEPGSWSNDPTAFEYSWLRCDPNGANCVPIAGATSSTYLVRDDDAGATLRVRVVAIRGENRSAPSDSTPTVVVTGRGEGPDTQITAAPADRASVAPTFGFTASVAGATFECRFDGEPFAPCRTPFTRYGLALGDHTFSVRAVAPDGSRDPTPATRNFALTVTSVTQECSVQVPWLTGGIGCQLFSPSTNPPSCPDGAQCTLTTTVDVHDGDDDASRGGGVYPSLYVPRTRYGVQSVIVCDSDPKARDALEEGACPASGSISVVGAGHKPLVGCIPSLTPVRSEKDPRRGPDEQRFMRCTATLRIEPVVPLKVLVGGTSATTQAPGPGQLTVTAPAASNGRVVAAEVAQKRPRRRPPFKPFRANVKRAGAVTIKLKLSASARRTLTRRHKLTLRLKLKFKPAGGGKTMSKTQRITLRKPLQRCARGSRTRCTPKRR